MEQPRPASKGVVRRSVRDGALDEVRDGARLDTTNDRPHCADHAGFQSDCVVCRRACANSQPYPMQKTKPAVRSFGFTDKITKENLQALDPKFGDVGAGDPGYGVSFVVLRVLWRLIWPF
jgi:hypothetical protein